MLVTSRARRCAFFVPVTLLVFTGTAAALAGRELIRALRAGVGVGALVAVALFAFMLSGVRLLTVRGDSLVARSPFSRRAIDARSCAFGISVRHSARGGATYTVYAASGAQLLELCEQWTERGAQHALTRLREALLRESPDAADETRRHAARASI
ncbi:MAG TPA: hypothetical protein VK524_08375, partial [Polyangiaceae bacterium]|nr:hypothetical protein [Polyangiaceae bacterium]